MVEHHDKASSPRRGGLLGIAADRGSSRAAAGSRRRASSGFLRRGCRGIHERADRRVEGRPRADACAGKALADVRSRVSRIRQGARRRCRRAAGKEGGGSRATRHARDDARGRKSSRGARRGDGEARRCGKAPLREPRRGPEAPFRCVAPHDAAAVRAAHGAGTTYGAGTAHGAGLAPWRRARRQGVSGRVHRRGAG